MYLRTTFASVCLIAVVARAEHHADYNVEHTIMDRTLKVHPDKIPNWMRGFYDDFPKEKRPVHVRQPHHRDQQYYHEMGVYPESHAEEAYERSHQGREFTTFMPSHEELARHSSYQRAKHSAYPYESERHTRGAFRDDHDSRYFTMHPVRPEYRH